LQQLKGEYKIVKAMRDLSGFGWDKGQQRVTAPLEVWDKYLEVRLVSANAGAIFLNGPSSTSKPKSVLLRKRHSPCSIMFQNSAGMSLLPAPVDFGPRKMVGTVGKGQMVMGAQTMIKKMGMARTRTNQR
jgi:hypothetical protein